MAGFLPQNPPPSPAQILQVPWSTGWALLHRRVPGSHLGQPQVLHPNLPLDHIRTPPIHHMSQLPCPARGPVVALVDLRRRCRDLTRRCPPLESTPTPILIRERAREFMPPCLRAPWILACAERLRGSSSFPLLPPPAPLSSTHRPWHRSPILHNLHLTTRHPNHHRQRHLLSACSSPLAKMVG